MSAEIAVKIKDIIDESDLSLEQEQNYIKELIELHEEFLQSDDELIMMPGYLDLLEIPASQIEDLISQSESGRAVIQAGNNRLLATWIHDSVAAIVWHCPLGTSSSPDPDDDIDVYEWSVEDESDDDADDIPF